MSTFLRSAITAVCDYRAELGETPVWCQRSQSLLWMDILNQRLLRYWPDTQAFEQRTLPALCSAALLTEKAETFLLVAENGLSLYDYQTEHTELLCGYPGEAGTRPNEAAIAPDGSLWFGTMDRQEEAKIGAWYRFEMGDELPLVMMDKVGIPNTLAWYEGKVWFADSMQNRFYSGNARRINPLKISCFSSGDKTPDGSTLSEDGLLLTACWGGHCLLRQQINQGELLTLDTLSLPVAQPSCCTFGGADMRQLFITSARKGLATPGDIDGALLQVNTATRGAGQHLFRLSANH
ncbi:SMP-30/gluconolactonase/LRE family protein [Rahnella sp. SAP-1]|uniref:SMP-30/gluconolactonase/LRE family protein n=1 Tax=Rouxiella aceris TaxID=2703884 RepID=A0A848MJ24_9GAMM|nr:SMP-30/gluconolactonase/LRE family protein [Rouxiella aceris]NMP27705.1 SMP-30/gluconolactonase/LRE family protein [Rouxiella aceris]